MQYSEDLKFLYKQLLNKLAVNAKDEYKETELAFFGGMQFENYDEGLMIVGRAVNGWTRGFTKTNEHNLEERFKRFYQGVQRPITTHLVKGMKEDDYFIPKNNSAFWRVSKRIAEETKNEIKFSTNIFYSNLYKASNANGGNPSSKLCKVQRTLCAEILKCEIELFKPKIILFLTGSDWAEFFVKEYCLKLTNREEFHYVRKTGIRNNIKIIVSKHPERKPEDIQVKEIISSLNIIE